MDDRWSLAADLEWMAVDGEGDGGAMKVLALTAVLLGGLTLTIPVESHADRGESVRFATYNVQFIPSTFLVTTVESRARKIADRILASDYDFVVLNEVFDEEMRDILWDRLLPAYPHGIKYIGGAALTEDSGLMLFSRLPFVDIVADTSFAVCPVRPELPSLDYFFWPQSCSRTIEGNLVECHGTDCSKLAFTEYDDCDDGPLVFEDCDADKGAAFVRLQNPRTGRIFNIGFTHTQASYQFPPGEEDDGDEREHQTTRRRQLQKALQVMRTSAGPAIGEEMFLLGDLNIDGNLNNLVMPFDIYTQEWVNAFGDAATFETEDGYLLREGFVDAWATDVATAVSRIDDPALTNAYVYGPLAEDIAYGGGRLDYVVRRADNALCVQRMAIAHEMRWSPDGQPLVEAGMGLAGREQLSDHLGIGVDVNLATSGCRVTDAIPVDVADGATASVEGEIQYPGGMQWYRLPRAGSTYSVWVEGADFRVFRVEDLSVPVPVFKGRTVPVAGGAGETYHNPDLIQVFRSNREAMGPFTLHVLRHDCASREQACALGPAEGWFQSVSDGVDAWSLAVPETVPRGASRTTQHVTYLLRSIDESAAPYLLLEVRGPDGATVLATGLPEPDPERSGSYRIAIDLPEPGGSPRYLVARQQVPSFLPPPTAPIPFTAGWRTDMSIFHGARWGHRRPMHLYCYEESDPWGNSEDTITLDYIKVDERKRQVGRRLGGFDAGSLRPLEHLLLPEPPIDRIAFFDSVVVRFLEEDNLTGDDAIAMTIRALRPDERGAALKQQARDDEDDGRYGLFYSVAHGFDESEPEGLAPDADGDGISDADEALYGTGVDDPDSDDDGMLDGDEVRLHGTDPLDDDSDDDGASDGAELEFPFTNPLDPDTDDDGLLDGPERALGTNPHDPDSDDDGLTDGDEVHVYGTNPLVGDTDGDQLNDRLDNCPLDPNTDQSNRDGDRAGDVCDDNDAALEVRRAGLRRSSGIGRLNGKIVVSGHIVLASPTDAFDASAGVAVEAYDGLGLDVRVAWTPDQCWGLRSGRVTCRSELGKLKQLSEPLTARAGRIRFRLRLTHREIAGPFGPDFTLRITHSPPVARRGIDRVGVIGTCRVTANGMFCF